MSLASIQVISEIIPIEKADKIALAKVIGWQSVVKKEDFKVGDKIIFIEIDTILPDAPWSAFLKSKDSPDKPIRLRTVRLRGATSQGLCLPITVLPLSTHSEVGTDVTEILGVKKYEKQIPAQLAGIAQGNFPTHLVPKTDELNVLSHPKMRDELVDKVFYFSCKMDGTSSTFYLHDDRFGVCSRNLELKEGENVYWQIARHFEIEEKLRDDGRSLAIQAEICGPSINGGHTGIKQNCMFIFDIYDIDNQRYFNLLEMGKFTEKYQLPMVDLIDGDIKFNKTISELEEYAAKLTYRGTDLPIEGIVVRPVEPMMSVSENQRLSFKVLNKNFLIKYGE